MLEESLNHGQQCDIFIACAAVADYRPEKCANQKLKKEVYQDTLSLTLIKNPDIVSQIAKLPQKPFMVGFAAETHELISHAKDKLEKKGLDMIAANDVSNQEIGFNSEQNALTLIYRNENYIKQEELAPASKFTIACQLIERIAKQIQ
jgi:phosphopantothenoylcysteine decarboxylase/phosphopantothenate--cysteine ligase